MKSFDVYPLFPIEPVKAQGSWLWDKNGKRYLDFYGGHAVISIGHSHPHYIQALQDQLSRIGFYSNSVQNSIQENLANKLGEVSGYPEYQLFLCSSGAEANENALKIASFETGRKKVIAFNKAFHGRTSGTVAITDNKKFVAPFNAGHDIQFLPFNDEVAFTHAMVNDTAAVIIEGIQGVGGIHTASPSFLKLIAEKCKAHGALLILDEIQSGYGRTGKFFAHQHAGIKPDLITVAKGMGNGFPVGGVLIHPDIKPWHGMLGATFGGNHLACAASLAVLEVIEKENLIANADKVGNYLISALRKLPLLEDIRGRGLMLGFDVPHSIATLRKDLLYKHAIFTGEAYPHTIRLLPSLAIAKEQADLLIEAIALETQKPVSV